MTLRSHMTGVFRKSYDLVALLALLHMAALAGLAAYLLGTGTISLEKMRDIGALLRGDARVAPPAGPGPQIDPEPHDAPADQPPTPDAVAALEKMDVLHWEAERVKAELDQRLALNNSIMLRVAAEKTAFHNERDEAEARDEAALAAMRDEGFQKQIAIYEGLAPKIAVQHLLALGSPDEAARILLQMETRKARKIVEAAKRGDQLISMQRILARVREVAPDRSADFDGE